MLLVVDDEDVEHQAVTPARYFGTKNDTVVPDPLAGSSVSP